MTRRLGVLVGVIPLTALYLAAALGERLLDFADARFWRLRDWMDVSPEEEGRANG